MERSEIAELIRQVNATYPNAKPVTPTAEPVWIEDLGDLETADVRVAFATHRRAGHAFPPTCAELRRLVLELQEPTPRFEHAWSAIHKAISRHGIYCEEAARDALEPVPLAWDLVLAMGGWRQVCLGGPDEYEPTNAGVWRSQAEHAWKALAEERRTDQAVVDIPSPLPRVTQAYKRLAGIPDPVLKPLAPLSEALPALPPPPAQQPHDRERLRAIAQGHVGSNGNGLKPEYRAEIERMIREGQEAKVPERWRQYVPEIKAAMEAVGG